MTRTLPAADIRGFYSALGITLAAWARTEVAVRCFAAPDAHRRDDRNPSCSVNLIHGAWHCHGCGAKGGAFDAAIARGYANRDAIDLMVTHGLTSYRVDRCAQNRPPRGRGSTQERAATPMAGAAPASEQDLLRWRTDLAGNVGLIARLARERGWLYATMLELGLGFDRRRITIPVRDDRARLIGLLRYEPWARPGVPKMVAAARSRRSLLPHPAAETSRRVLLVEGEPDMIAARSHGLPAIAVPGVAGWQSKWLPLLADREVVVVMDCDEPGRRAAAAIAHDLSSVSDVRTLDLAPERHDGYDLSDWLMASHPLRTVCGSQAGLGLRA